MLLKDDSMRRSRTRDQKTITSNVSFLPYHSNTHSHLSFKSLPYARQASLPQAQILEPHPNFPPKPLTIFRPNDPTPPTHRPNLLPRRIRP